MDPTNLIIVLFVIGLIAVIILVRYFINLGAHKAEDAIRNAKKKLDMQKNPPQQENLAERYRDINNE